MILCVICTGLKTAAFVVGGSHYERRQLRRVYDNVGVVKC